MGQNNFRDSARKRISRISSWTLFRGLAGSLDHPR